MIEAGKLTQEDADEYVIELDDTYGWSIKPKRLHDDGCADTVLLKMTNQDALELAAQLLIGAVYNASDSDWREVAWKEVLRKRIQESRSRARG